jgi:nitrate/TMAO reductase-like tetraheme cytochrome c subunit
MTALHAGWRDRAAAWIRPAVYLGENAITLAGAVITTSSALTLLIFWVYEIVKGGPVHAYTGILFFLLLPAGFVLGLLLMPLGAWRRRRKLHAAGRLPTVYPRIDFHEPLLRRAAFLVGGTTVLNVAILGTATYRGVEYMDSVQFCGQSCHSVMAPEYTAYLGSPHSRVACVECHIGPGAPWFVRAKLSGVRQVFAVALETHSRPIPSPVKHLRPARETCEQCHWPQKFHGDKFLVRAKYEPDEKNTPLTTVLVLKLGGRTWQGLTGIHGRHLDENERIRYVAIDERRQVIPVVTYLDDDGRTVEYVSTEVRPTPEQLARGERRTMDCVDCHNRPTHAFDLPERAVDRAMSEGRISPQLPYAKKKAVELLRAEYPDRPTALERIPAAFVEFYRKEYPETYRSHRALVEAAADSVRGIYEKNVFPSMKVTWGTHPNNIGHEDFLGCFRCHDDQHRSADGRVISQDCNACHTVLAMDDPNPKVLQDLGLQ